MIEINQIYLGIVTIYLTLLLIAVAIVGVYVRLNVLNERMGRTEGRVKGIHTRLDKHLIKKGD